MAEKHLEFVSFGNLFSLLVRYLYLRLISILVYIDRSRCSYAIL